MPRIPSQRSTQDRRWRFLRIATITGFISSPNLPVSCHYRQFQVPHNRVVENDGGNKVFGSSMHILTGLQQQLLELISMVLHRAQAQLQLIWMVLHHHSTEPSVLRISPLLNHRISITLGCSQFWIGNRNNMVPFRYALFNSISTFAKWHDIGIYSRASKKWTRLISTLKEASAKQSIWATRYCGFTFIEPKAYRLLLSARSDFLCYCLTETTGSPWNF